MKIVVSVYVSPNYFLLLLIVSSLSTILIAVLFVFSRSWTSLAGVVKLPRVSNAFEDYTPL